MKNRRPVNQFTVRKNKVSKLSNDSKKTVKTDDFVKEEKTGFVHSMKQIFKEIRSFISRLFGRNTRYSDDSSIYLGKSNIVKRYNKPHHRTKKVRTAKILAKHNRNRN